MFQPTAVGGERGSVLVIRVVIPNPGKERAVAELRSQHVQNEPALRVTVVIEQGDQNRLYRVDYRPSHHRRCVGKDVRPTALHLGPKCAVPVRVLGP